MQRFRFTLETLLNLRRRKEEEAKLALAAKSAEVKKARQELADIGRQLKELQDQQKQERMKGCNVDSMRRGVAYRHKLKLDMLAKGNQIERLQQEAEAKRKDLVKATQKVRSLELLRERRYAEWRREFAREEQGFIDDVSGQGYIRRKKAATVVR